MTGGRYPLAAARRVRAVATQGAQATHVRAVATVDEALAVVTSARAVVATADAACRGVQTAVEPTRAGDLVAQHAFAARLRARLVAAKADAGAAEVALTAARRVAEAQRALVGRAHADQRVVEEHEARWQVGADRRRERLDE